MKAPDGIPTLKWEFIINKKKYLKKVRKKARKMFSTKLKIHE